MVLVVKDISEINKNVPCVVPFLIDSESIVNDLVESAKNIGGDFPDKKGKSISLYAQEGYKKVSLYCMGKKEDVKNDDIREFAGKSVTAAIDNRDAEISFVISHEDCLEKVMEAATLSNFIFDRYKGAKLKEEDRKRPLEAITIYMDNPKDYTELMDKIENVCNGTFMAREWVSTPAIDLYPEVYANQVAEIAKMENLDVKIYEEADLKKMGFNTLLSVSVGSDKKPKFVVVEYKPDGAEETVALVGKGVTFDSGGLSLKPGNSMEDMKSDMGGSALVAATIITAARLGLKKNIIAALPMVENMPSGSAVKPGDVVTAYNGKTVEILNTDAEGRLILADSISYINKTYKPDTLFDFATLTGACVVALGEKIAAVYSNNQEKADKLIESSQSTYERCWKMPLPDDYNELLKSDIADLRNISTTRYGGSITAALFLQEFVEEGTDWVHVDIAGPAFQAKASAYVPQGGTGFGVRLMIDYLMK